MGARSVLWVVLGGVVAAVVCAALGVVGISAGATSLSTTGAVVGRSVLSLAALAVVVLLVVRRGPWSPLPAWLGLGLIAFVLNPLTWTAGADAGGALFGVAVTGSTWPGTLLDLVVWLGVTAGAAVLAERSLDGED